MDVERERGIETPGDAAGGRHDDEMSGIPAVAPAMAPPAEAMLDEAAAEDTDRPLVAGMPLVTVDGDVLGTVGEVAADRFKVAAPMAPDYWLPLDAITGMAPGGDLVVGYTQDELDRVKLDGPGE